MSNVLFEIKLKNDKRIIPELASFISNSAFKLGLSKRKSFFLCFVLETILELRIDDISEDNPEIKLLVEDNGTSFKFSVTDLGAPYILTKNQSSILKNGLVDRYSFEQLGRKGQCFSFVYKYDAIEYDEIIKPKEEETLLDTDFIFRRLKNDDNDILEAIKCLYAAYGYDYYHQKLYSVDSFKRYIQSGRYTPIIGENKNHQFMCYCALDENEWFLGIPEFSNLVTKPIARGRNLATMIFNETEKIAKEMNYEGIHVSAVAYHPYTQKMCNKLNYTPCAIEYSINPAGTGGYDKDRRLDCVLGVKIFNKTKKHILYLEQNCSEMIKTIFEKESLNYEIINDLSTYGEDDVMTYIVDADTNNSFIKIDECSESFKDKLEKIINSEEVKTMDVITVNLNMNHPSALYGYKVLKELGFICVGCLPGSVNGDYLLLQTFKEKPAYEKIVLESNYQELADKVIELNNIK